MPSAACNEELETLTAIFLDEIAINDSLPDEGAQVSMVLFPATGDDEESRYVTLTLEISLCKNYPMVPPQIVFRNPRGLNDDMLDDLMKAMKEKCEESIGSQMIYELIDMGKEFLTRNNRPASECPICLLSFTEFDVFYRSDCFHHFHSYCLGHYLKNILDAAPENEPSTSMTRKVQTVELNCPVCRERFSSDLDINLLVSAPPPSEESDSANKDSEAVLKDWKNKRQDLQEIFEKQKRQGGIIDHSEKPQTLLISNSSYQIPPPVPLLARLILDERERRVAAAAVAAIPSTDATSARAQQMQSGDATSAPGAHESERNQSRPRQNSNGQSNICKNRGIPAPNPNHNTVPNTASANVGNKQNSDATSNESPQQASVTDEESERGGGRSGNSNYRKFRRGEGYNRRRHK